MTKAKADTNTPFNQSKPTAHTTNRTNTTTQPVKNNTIRPVKNRNTTQPIKKQNKTKNTTKHSQSKPTTHNQSKTTPHKQRVSNRIRPVNRTAQGHLKATQPIKRPRLYNQYNTRTHARTHTQQHTTTLKTITPHNPVKKHATDTIITQPIQKEIFTMTTTRKQINKNTLSHPSASLVVVEVHQHPG